MIDLHAHSNVSDGTDTPAELMVKAATAGLSTIALTDHDTTGGWAEAAAACQELGLTFVPGIEMTVRNQGRSQHLLGYWPDPTGEALTGILDRLITSRDERMLKLLANLNSHGVAVTEATVRDFAGQGVIGKPHVADALVAGGYVSDRAHAFATWLADDHPVYVARWAPTIEEAIAALVAAGAAPVIAHSRARGSDLSEERYAELQTLGMVGIEVDHQDHPDDVRAELRGIAANLGLVVTGSSDHHGSGKVDHDLGCNTTSSEAFEALRSFRRVGSP